jgi:hypothetical protein
MSGDEAEDLFRRTKLSSGVVTPCLSCLRHVKMRETRMWWAHVEEQCLDMAPPDIADAIFCRAPGAVQNGSAALFGNGIGRLRDSCAPAIHCWTLVPPKFRDPATMYRCTTSSSQIGGCTTETYIMHSCFYKFPSWCIFCTSFAIHIHLLPLGLSSKWQFKSKIQQYF